MYFTDDLTASSETIVNAVRILFNSTVENSDHENIYTQLDNQNTFLANDIAKLYAYGIVKASRVTYLLKYAELYEGYLKNIPLNSCDKARTSNFILEETKALSHYLSGIGKSGNLMEITVALYATYYMQNLITKSITKHKEGCLLTEYYASKEYINDFNWLGETVNQLVAGQSDRTLNRLTKIFLAVIEIYCSLYSATIKRSNETAGFFNHFLEYAGVYLDGVVARAIHLFELNIIKQDEITKLFLEQEYLFWRAYANATALAISKVGDLDLSAFLAHQLNNICCNVQKKRLKTAEDFGLSSKSLSNVGEAPFLLSYSNWLIKIGFECEYKQLFFALAAVYIVRVKMAEEIIKKYSGTSYSLIWSSTFDLSEGQSAVKKYIEWGNKLTNYSSMSELTKIEDAFYRALSMERQYFEMILNR